MWVGGERAQPEAITEKMGIFQWAGSIHYRLVCWIADENHPAKVEGSYVGIRALRRSGSLRVMTWINKSHCAGG